MKEYCIKVNDSFYTGNKKEIIQQIFPFNINKERVLTAKLIGCVESTYHSYSSSYTKDEMEDDVVSFLFNKLSENNVEIYIKN